MTANNDSWTATAAGTPTGDLLRRFWLPIAPVDVLDSNPIKLVHVLSEGLVIFRDESGAPGMMQQFCPHNGVALVEGHVDVDGIICREHGWHFYASGDACVKLPSRPLPLPRFKGRAYPVRERGDIYWAYLGSQPEPPLPEDEVLVRTDGYRVITVFPSIDQNWLVDNWCESSDWQRQFGVTKKEGSDVALPLLLRLPADDAHTHQVGIEFISKNMAGASPAEVVYLDENEAWDKMAPVKAQLDSRESLLAVLRQASLGT